MKTQKIALGMLVALVILVVISVIITFAAQVSFLSSLRIVFGSLYVLFLPGLVISYIFFPKTKKLDDEPNEDDKVKNSQENRRLSGSIDWIERIALSFALSIAIVPLAVFYLNLIGVRINLLNSFLTILGVLVVSFIVLYIKKKK
jgi:uncharacterized membrane protein